MKLMTVNKIQMQHEINSITLM